MAVTFVFSEVEGAGAVKIEQKEDGDIISTLEFAKNNVLAFVSNGYITISLNALFKITIERAKMIPAQATDAQATTFLQSLLYS